MAQDDRRAEVDPMVGRGQADKAWGKVTPPANTQQPVPPQSPPPSPPVESDFWQKPPAPGQLPRKDWD